MVPDARAAREMAAASKPAGLGAAADDLCRAQRHDRPPSPPRGRAPPRTAPSRQAAHRPKTRRRALQWFRDCRTNSPPYALSHRRTPFRLHPGGATRTPRRPGRAASGVRQQRRAAMLRDERENRVRCRSPDRRRSICGCAGGAADRAQRDRREMCAARGPAVLRGVAGRVGRSRTYTFRPRPVGIRPKTPSCMTSTAASPTGSTIAVGHANDERDRLSPCASRSTRRPFGSCCEAEVKERSRPSATPSRSARRSRVTRAPRTAWRVRRGRRCPTRIRAPTPVASATDRTATRGGDARARRGPTAASDRTETADRRESTSA